LEPAKNRVDQRIGVLRGGNRLEERVLAASILSIGQQHQRPSHTAWIHRPGLFQRVRQAEQSLPQGADGLAADRYRTQHEALWTSGLGHDSAQ